VGFADPGIHCGESVCLLIFWLHFAFIVFARCSYIACSGNAAQTTPCKNQQIPKIAHALKIPKPIFIATTVCLC